MTVRKKMARHPPKGEDRASTDTKLKELGEHVNKATPRLIPRADLLERF